MKYHKIHKEKINIEETLRRMKQLRYMSEKIYSMNYFFYLCVYLRQNINEEITVERMIFDTLQFNYDIKRLIDYLKTGKKENNQEKNEYANNNECSDNVIDIPRDIVFIE
jgi:hypothetical protein